MTLEIRIKHLNKKIFQVGIDRSNKYHNTNGPCKNWYAKNIIIQALPLYLFLMTFLLQFLFINYGLAANFSDKNRCNIALTQVSSANLSEYYQLKKEIDAEFPDLESLDNKNLAGTYYSLIPQLNQYPFISTHTELIAKLGQIFEIPFGQSIGLGTGVRSILKDVFSQLAADGYHAVLPEDVYPVYEILAQESQLPYRKFQSIPDLRIAPQELAREKTSQTQITIVGKEVLVLTSPLSPLGRALTPAEVLLLKSWLNSHFNRRLLLDTVYTFDNHFDEPTLDLLKSPQVMAIHSFAKSFLIPGHLGFAVGSPQTFGRILHKLDRINYDLASKAIAIISRKANLPEILKTEFKNRWNTLAPLITRHLPQWMPPENGYFSLVPISAGDLLKTLGIWSFPLSTFGSANTTMTVISALPNKVENLYYVTVLSNFARGFDKYEMTYSKRNIPESSFPDKFFLLQESELEIGLNKARELLKKTKNGDRILIISTSENVANLLPNERNGKARYLMNNKIAIENLYYIDDLGEKKSVRMEDVYADSLLLNRDRFVAIEKIRPRSISILPIAQACQLCCKFCFSDASISAEKRGKGLTDDLIVRALEKAKDSGAERAVITGGGEPTLIGFPKLNRLVQLSNNYFPGKVTLISNGLKLAKLGSPEILKHLIELDQSGLSVLSISRHHNDRIKNQLIMGEDNKTENIFQTYLENRKIFKNLRLRLICVLQKTGIALDQDIDNYIDWARRYEISEINFKELYVSTDRESKYSDGPSNIYSERNRVHLRVVLNYAQKNGWKKIMELPWGAPIFEKIINGMRMQMAAYTEPSLFWERDHGIARSWNLMADGTLTVSLEDGETVLHLD